MGADQRTVNSRPQRKALETVNGDLWILPRGTLVCTHGNTRRTLGKIARDPTIRLKGKNVVRCSCKISIPRRCGSVFTVIGTPSSAEDDAHSSLETDVVDGGAVAEVGNEMVVTGTDS